MFDHKIHAIKAIRELVSRGHRPPVVNVSAGAVTVTQDCCTLGLKEAKEFVEACMELGAREARQQGENSDG